MKTSLTVLLLMSSLASFAQEAPAVSPGPQEITITDHDTGKVYTMDEAQENYRRNYNNQFKNAEFAGGKDGGGGDPEIMWRTILKDEDAPRFSNDVLAHAITIYIGDMTNRFRGRMAAIIMGLNPMFIADPDVRAQFVKLREDGLIEDVSRSQLLVRNRCFVIENDERIYKSATSLINQPNTDICVDPVELAKKMDGFASSHVLFGLFIHEYIHHFGILDADHKFAIEMALAYKAFMAAEKDHLTLIAHAYEEEWAKDEPWIQQWKKCIAERTCFPD